jgi:hypothetical protein
MYIVHTVLRAWLHRPPRQKTLCQSRLYHPVREQEFDYWFDSGRGGGGGGRYGRDTDDPVGPQPDGQMKKGYKSIKDGLERIIAKQFCTFGLSNLEDCVQWRDFLPAKNVHFDKNPGFLRWLDGWSSCQQKPHNQAGTFPIKVKDFDDEKFSIGSRENCNFSMQK